MRWVYNLRVAPGWGLREPCRGECLSPSAALLGVLVLLGPRAAGAPRDAGHPSLWPPANDLHPLRGLVSASSWAFPACSTSQTGPPGAEGSAFVSPVCPSCPTGPPGTEGRAPAAGSRKGAVSCTPKQVWGGTQIWVSQGPAEESACLLLPRPSGCSCYLAREPRALPDTQGIQRPSHGSDDGIQNLPGQTARTLRVSDPPGTEGRRESDTLLEVEEGRL
ncbi:MAG: hypothetical protein CNCCGFBP_02432 [Fimbriimonadaceae bacterium]|nr:hypothetical protein [Fimbriimonadaceae bacterium]